MEARPDFVIGVDFGMTATGVAYCQAPWTNVKTFQNWSGLSHEISNKVPSKLCYSSTTRQLLGWGLNCDLRNPDADLVEHFKLHLDPEYRDQYDAISHDEAKEYYKDFLTKVHHHVVSFLINTIPSWRQRRVEWVFSVPTTWMSPSLMATLLNLLRSAGFGQDAPGHQVRITLTEAEAAAISVMKDQMDFGDVVAVCDAGGGTTDVNILKVKTPRGQPIQLSPLLKVEGRPVGSALIDIRVQQYLVKCLSHVAHRLSRSPAEVAEEMMFEKFERFKCSYGTPETMIKLPLEIPGLPSGIEVPAAGISNSRIDIPQSLLKTFFDEQVREMIQLLHEQFTTLARTQSHVRISYLVLSGGLGSSQYVRDQVRTYFTSGPGSAFQNVRGMQLMLAENPQLAPVLGLVEDRAQELGQRVTAIQERVARVSYGLVVNQEYDPKKYPEHLNSKVILDPRDKKRWVLNQIEWIIREGDRLPKEGKSRAFNAKLHDRQRRQPWKAQFVQCREPRDRLPGNFHDDAVRPLCVIEADISGAKGVEMNKHFWNLGVRHELARVDLQVKPGAADLQFELWNQGRLLTNEHEKVAVEWDNSRRVQSAHEGHT